MQDGCKMLRWGQTDPELNLGSAIYELCAFGPLFEFSISISSFNWNIKSIICFIGLLWAVNEIMCKNHVSQGVAFSRCQINISSSLPAVREKCSFIAF